MPLYVDEAECAQPTPGHPPNVLATVRFGADQTPPSTAPWLALRAPNRPLSPGPATEIWAANGEASRLAIEGAVAAADDRCAFVAVETYVEAGEPVDRVTFDVYRRLLRGITAAGYPHVLRMWNYVPRIHERESGIDRYMRFCKGRSEAFAMHYGEAFADRLPAASAVGCPGEALIVHALASREPGCHVENPRQTSAYRYPERYGPKSPTFARGTVAGESRDRAVFVSGTASIVGHESVFPDDPARQTEETMRNVEAVLDAADVPGRGGPLGPRLSSLRVYVRFPAHVDAIRGVILARAGAGVPTAWLQAEICRKELVVEIEATARMGAKR